MRSVVQCFIHILVSHILLPEHGPMLQYLMGRGQGLPPAEEKPVTFHIPVWMPSPQVLEHSDHMTFPHWQSMDVAGNMGFSDCVIL